MVDPLQDLSRLSAIAALDLTSPEVRVALDEAAARAASIVGVPIGLVSIVLDGAQWFAGSSGLSGWLSRTKGTPAEWAFCTNVVRTGRALVVEDARHDERFRDNPLVTAHGVGTYAGVPLVSYEGHVLGSLCAIGPTPIALNATKLEALDAVARELTTQLRQVDAEHRRL